VLTRAAEDPEEYRKTLFDPYRLEVKFACFERLTVRGIRKQLLSPGQRMRWLIFASPSMPEKYRVRLQSAVLNVRGALVLWVDSMQEFASHMEAEVHRLEVAGLPYATVRLDDDDYLAPSFFRHLSSYSEHQGQIVSFISGRHVSVSLDARSQEVVMVVGQPVVEPYNAFGMSMIGGNIYAAGNHKRVAQKYVVHLDHTPDMWWATCSPVSDTWRKKPIKPAPGLVPIRVPVRAFVNEPDEPAEEKAESKAEVHSTEAEEPSVGVGEEPSVGVGEEPSVGVGEEPSVGVGEEPSVGVGEEPSPQTSSSSIQAPAAVDEPTRKVIEHASLLSEVAAQELGSLDRRVLSLIGEGGPPPQRPRMSPVAFPADKNKRMPCASPRPQKRASGAVLPVNSLSLLGALRHTRSFRR
jgi:hypothetical protein